ncbi:MAG: peptidylprolyl isomerase [Desulfuromonadales bacterium]|jgi:cyclophilin family peptidyl-prolyl cis-trans isomerase|nr:peptidylprolyl isomerase [Desulfuromonadales bacterium]MDH3868379.1 peptidylprolyl isomerase [Desulfuromonadales bacterium]MDH4026160.1 peptidylprolyl isomerase [Desulfuromonadales bacterium]
MSETTNPTVRIETSMGKIVLELDAVNAPISTANFIAYANDGFYEDTIFHRVIDGFMVQGGGLTADMSDKSNKKAPIKNEAANGLKNDHGTVAMARTNVVDSATSQFFINVGENSFLNHTAPTPQGFGYAVFGKVTDGMDVVDAIRQVKTGNKGMHQDVPVETITIQKVTVE